MEMNGTNGKKHDLSDFVQLRINHTIHSIKLTQIQSVITATICAPTRITYIVSQQDTSNGTEHNGNKRIAFDLHTSPSLLFFPICCSLLPKLDYNKTSK